MAQQHNQQSLSTKIKRESEEAAEVEGDKPVE